MVIKESLMHHDRENQNQPTAMAAPTTKTILTIPVGLILTALKPSLVFGRTNQISSEMDSANQCELKLKLQL